MDYERCVVPLGLALTALALASKLLNSRRARQVFVRKAKPSLSSTPAFKKAKRLLQIYSKTGRYSPLLRQPRGGAPQQCTIAGKRTVEGKRIPSQSPVRYSRTPVRSVSPISTKATGLSLDLSRMSTSDSELRIETERVRRMSNLCLHLERKTLWVQAKTEREVLVRRSLQEEALTLRQRQKHEEDFHRIVQQEAERSKAAERHLRDTDWASRKESLLRQKVSTSERDKDDLRRSCEQLSLSAYSKARAAETRRIERADRSQDRRDFAQALKAAQQSEKPQYARQVTSNLKFQLQQALSKNQEIVKRIMQAGFVGI